MVSITPQITGISKQIIGIIRLNIGIVKQIFGAIRGKQIGMLIVSINNLILGVLNPRIMHG